MLKYCLDKWNQNNGLLRSKLENDFSLNTCDYVYLVKLVVEHILNPGENHRYGEWDSRHITVIDNGDYQGTLLFLIPMKTYQPREYEYLMTCVSYGSCHACDTLQAIQDRSNNRLTERQVKDIMTLCKDIVTNMVKPYNGGWRFMEDFEEVHYNHGE